MTNELVVATAAARRIGQATTIRLVEEGYALIVNDLLYLNSTLNLFGKEVNLVPLNEGITKADTINELMKRINRLDIFMVGLVKNAYNAVRKRFEGWSNEDWSRT